MLTPDEWVALIGAFTLLIGGVSAAIVSVVRAGAEVAAMRADLAAAAEKNKERADNQDRLLKEAHHELTPNSGGSLKDATTRLEAAVAELRAGQSRMAASNDRLEAAQNATAKDIRGLRRDVGRLADSDFQLTIRADKEHERIHQRIDDIAIRLPDPLADPHVD